jgi:nucleotide-binding universal stress UspA family protein
MPALRRMLVPLDGSRLAEAVLPAAFALAARCGAAVTLLHVIEHDAPETVHGQPHLDDAEEAAAYLRAVAARAGAAVPVELHVHPNREHDVARSIAEHADELGADLVVLATHGSGGLRGFLFGRIAQQVLRYTKTPVLLIRPLEDGTAPSFGGQALLVPLDGSPEAEAALPYAALLATATGAAVHLVRVVPTLGTVSTRSGPAATFTPAATAALLDIEEEQARGYLAEVSRRDFPAQRATAEVRRGDVVAELARAIAASQAELVILGTHGRSGLAGFFTGSVAARLLSRVDAPLLLIRVNGE